MLDESEAALIVVGEATVERAVEETKRAKKEMKKEIRAEAKEIEKAIDEAFLGCTHSTGQLRKSTSLEIGCRVTS